MKQFNTVKTAQALVIAAVLSVAAVPAQAQSSDEALGAIIGGSLGAVIGGSVDNKGSNQDGVIVGAAVGGTLGYLIGSQNNDYDRNMRTRYATQRGEYYRHNGQSYRRYKDRDHGYVTIRIESNDPYYYQDGRRRDAQQRRSDRRDYKRRRNNARYYN